MAVRKTGLKQKLRRRILQIHRRLAKAYGPSRRRRRDAVSELVSTILSQNTNDRLRDLAYARLRQRFSTWEDVRRAPPRQIISAIRPAGLAYQKGPRIKSALDRIFQKRGKLSLDFLHRLPVSEARDWLTAIPGVGPKTAAIVLLFSLGKPAFPVDTHIHRVTRRLGLLGPKVSREKAHQILEELVPPSRYYDLHLLLIEHGRRICRAPQPRCRECVLKDLCPYYKNVFLSAQSEMD